MSKHPQRRTGDRGWRRVLENVWLGIITVVVILIAAKAFDASSTAADHERTTHAALCTFWNDLDQRVTGGNAFLATHPHGAFGLSAAQLRSSIQGQQRTLRSLNGLGCRRPVRRRPVRR